MRCVLKVFSRNKRVKDVRWHPKLGHVVSFFLAMIFVLFVVIIIIITVVFRSVWPAWII